MTNILCKGTIIKPKGKKNKMDFLKRAWAEVDLDSIEYNLKEYRRLIGEKTEIMCVVKASCYGHFDNGVVPFLETKWTFAGLRYPTYTKPTGSGIWA